MDSPTSDAAFEALCARLVAGENVCDEDIPLPWRELPQVQRLLQFARVMQGLAHGLAADADPAFDTHPADGKVDSATQSLLVGQWRLIRKLGSGGMGQVWLGARRDDTAHQVAIKLVHAASPSFSSRLIIERQILARLSHPNIARFIDAGIHADGAPWMALEYVEGSTLNEWCDQQRPSLRQRLQLFLKICAAVEHAHRHLVVHRDLKPGQRKHPD